MATTCDLHGKQDGLSCAECDKDAPQDVLAAREIAQSAPYIGADLQKLIADGVAAEMGRRERAAAQ